jgi:hypothetical protein
MTVHTTEDGNPAMDGEQQCLAPQLHSSRQRATNEQQTQAAEEDQVLLPG